MDKRNKLETITIEPGKLYQAVYHKAGGGQVHTVLFVGGWDSFDVVRQTLIDIQLSGNVITNFHPLH